MVSFCVEEKNKRVSHTTLQAFAYHSLGTTGLGYSQKGY